MSDIVHTWLDGDPLSTDKLDRGLLYGDGFFTTILLVDGQLANWNQHWARLKDSAERLKFPALNQANLMNDLISIIKSRPAEPFEILKILITRGKGGIGYQPAEKSVPSIYIQRLPFPQDASRKSLKIDQAWPFFELKMTLSETVCSQQPQLAGLKHLNRLENVLARQALMNTGFDEAVMLTQNGEIISATQSNLVLIEGNQLISPLLDQSGVQGTCLSSLPQALAEEGWTIESRHLSLADLATAEEIFCCNSVRGVMPVKQFQHKDFETEKGTKIAQAWLKWQAAHLTDVKELKP
ncbi:aminodeoxychorismate lyase [Hydrogenovibrio sp. 3SP14C1]|uniref:aminodeoxychorismate lyase n=1 Tax=Hydrogenovibrio sp. 3SP14C1 TaxID=3038774 RepID=UPI0024179CCD|nr:aminodeoxychorismate lyase [Hydrogenovibrio sp. 3SP14C1]MDG4813070.1 aminodeoxychorismate lyase [Hydrogenovibrio sp. 3SP14C1]